MKPVRLVVLLSVLVPLPALAQPGVRVSDDDRSVDTATPDPAPPAPEPDPERVADTVLEQAGVGGPITYGTAGVLEVGGAGRIWADDVSVGAHLRPYVGLFVVDAFQLTIANDVAIAWYDGQDLSLAHTITLEPSVHLPIATRVWFAVALGGGVAYNSVNAGAIGNARLGVDLLVGRSAMLHFHALGELASEPLNPPAQAVATDRHWRVGLEIAYGALF